MKQYIREYNGQMAYFDGQSTFELLDGAPFINLDISQLEEKFAYTYLSLSNRSPISPLYMSPVDSHFADSESSSPS